MGRTLCFDPNTQEMGRTSMCLKLVKGKSFSIQGPE
jgi:hypothetical protein